jgi:hypothetical protein
MGGVESADLAPGTRVMRLRRRLVRLYGPFIEVFSFALDNLKCAGGTIAHARPKPVAESLGHEPRFSLNDSNGPSAQDRAHSPQPLHSSSSISMMFRMRRMFKSFQRRPAFAAGRCNNPLAQNRRQIRVGR